MRALRSTNIALAAALIAGLFATSGFAQDPTDEAAAKIDEKFGGNIKKLFEIGRASCRERVYGRV